MYNFKNDKNVMTNKNIFACVLKGKVKYGRRVIGNWTFNKRRHSVLACTTVAGIYIGLRKSGTGSLSVSRVVATSASSATMSTTCRWVFELVVVETNHLKAFCIN